jgi:hypothetical protein
MTKVIAAVSAPTGRPVKLGGGTLTPFSYLGFKARQRSQKLVNSLVARMAKKIFRARHLRWNKKRIQQ